MHQFIHDFRSFLKFVLVYFRTKFVYLTQSFESFKNYLVDVLMFKRGILQKKVWHGSMIGLSAFGVITSGVFGGQTIVSSSFPGTVSPDPRFANSFELPGYEVTLNSLNDTQTTISQKPRDQIIDYSVKGGDTLSSIAQQFGISVDTIRWANDLNDDQIKPGQVLKILPVSGVAHSVKSGDTLESIAKKYSANSQAILDFPFNDIPDDLSLKIGQVLIVPDGIAPNSAPAAPKQTISTPSYNSSGSGNYYSEAPSSSFTAPGGTQFIWPTNGIITQNFSWYHPGIDIANNAAPPIYAAADGVVVVAGWPDNFGLGNRVVIDHGNGYTTTYGHMSNIYATVGEHVSSGQVIGQMGSTGRSTGTHCHFEIRYKGIAINPLSILQ